MNTRCVICAAHATRIFAINDDYATESRRDQIRRIQADFEEIIGEYVSHDEVVEHLEEHATCPYSDAEEEEENEMDIATMLRKLSAQQPGNARAIARADCCICLSKSVEMAFIPCGHACVCYGCAEKMNDTRCPQCRAVARPFKIFV